MVEDAGIEEDVMFAPIKNLYSIVYAKKKLIQSQYTKSKPRTLTDSRHFCVS